MLQQLRSWKHRTLRRWAYLDCCKLSLSEVALLKAMHAEEHLESFSV